MGELRTWDLHELTVVRVGCKNAGCGVVVEVSVNQVGQAFRESLCPVCHAKLAPHSQHGDPFEALARAFAGFQANAEQVRVEFVSRPRG